MTRTLPAAALALLLLSACGSAPAPGASSDSAQETSGTAPSASATASVTAGGEVFGLFTVLEEGSKGPMACSAVATSLPPQCSGPKIIGWDWATAPGKPDVANKVRWVDAALVGTWDGTALTLTRPATTPDDFRKQHTVPEAEPSFGTPCPAPAGGWTVLDPARTTHATMDQTIAAAQGLPTFGGLWVDQSVNPAAGNSDASPETAEAEMNNPEKLILNVRVTSDASAAEQLLRTSWGGMLCVSAGGRSEADLLAVQREIHANHPEVDGSGVDSQAGRVEVSTFYDDGSLQRELDEKYGAAIVVVQTHLLPFPPT